MIICWTFREVYKTLLKLKLVFDFLRKREIKKAQTSLIDLSLVSKQTSQVSLYSSIVLTTHRIISDG
jgi:hypothetical protein